MTLYIDAEQNLTNQKVTLLKQLKSHNSQSNFAIERLTATGQGVQISIHSPSAFMAENLRRVLPDWVLPEAWVVVVLQQSQYELLESTPEIEKEKERLRERFMRFGCDVTFALRDRGYLTNLIDPRTGYPLFSRPGELHHDDTAAVKALLGLPIIQNSCRVLVHPTWGTAVYPSTMISSAQPEVIQSALAEIAPQHGWH